MFTKFLAFPMRRLLLIFASICGISSRAAFNQVITECLNKATTLKQARNRYLFQTEKTPLKNVWSVKNGRLDLRSLLSPVQVQSLILPEETLSGGWMRAHFPEQRLVIEPTKMVSK